MEPNDIILTEAEAEEVMKLSPLGALRLDLKRFLDLKQIDQEDYDKRLAFIEAYGDFFPDLHNTREGQKSVNDVAILIRNFLQLLAMTEMYNKAPPPSMLALPVSAATPAPQLVLPPGVKR